MSLSKTWFNNTWIREQLNLPTPRTKVSNDLHDEIAALKAERDRLRAALERIVTGHHAEPVQEIARRALEGK